MSGPDVDSPHLRLAGVIRLSLEGGRGPRDAYVFDPHRLALPSWAHALGDGPPALLVTLDRHHDLVVPRAPQDVPDRSVGLHALDDYARWKLDLRNYDHVIAAMEAGLLTDALVIARSRPRGSYEERTYVDSRGRPHRIESVTTVDRAAQAFEEQGSAIQALVRGAERILLDVDLDCFTTLSDADPMEILPWPASVIREHLLPRDSEQFWTEVLGKTVALTLAREPHHCGGLSASAALFSALSPILFEELLGVPSP